MDDLHRILDLASLAPRIASAWRLARELHRHSIKTRRVAFSDEEAVMNDNTDRVTRQSMQRVHRPLMQ